MDTDSHTDEQIREILSLRNVAVIGMSKHSGKAANFVPKYLLSKGFNVIPVNPSSTEILNRKCYPNVKEIEEQIDIVEIFRPSEEVMPFVQDAIQKKPKVIWLQEGIHNKEAEELARNQGIDVVFNRCMLAEHQRLNREKSDFSDFYEKLLELSESFEQKNTNLKIQKDPDADIVKIFGENMDSLSRAKSGLEDISELSFTTAEHHPYWNLLYQTAQISKTLLEKWNDDLSKEDIDEIKWSLKELEHVCKKIQENFSNYN